MVLQTTLRTTLLLGALTGLLLAVGYVMAGREGAVVALLFAALVNGAAFWFSDRAALAMAGAQEISYAQAPGLYRLVATIAERAGLPMPRLAIVDAAAPNAFATGRDPRHAVVAVRDDRGVRAPGPRGPRRPQPHPIVRSCQSCRPARPTRRSASG